MRPLWLKGSLDFEPCLKRKKALVALLSGIPSPSLRTLSEERRGCFWERIKHHIFAFGKDMLQPLEWKRRIETRAPTYCSWYLIHKTWGRHVSPPQDFHKTCWCCPQCTSSCSRQTQQTQPAVQCLLSSGGERAEIKAPGGSHFLIAVEFREATFQAPMRAHGVPNTCQRYS